MEKISRYFAKNIALFWKKYRVIFLHKISRNNALFYIALFFAYIASFYIALFLFREITRYFYLASLRISRYRKCVIYMYQVYYAPQTHSFCRGFFLVSMYNAHQDFYPFAVNVFLEFSSIFQSFPVKTDVELLTMQCACSGSTKAAFDNSEKERSFNESRTLFAT